MKKFIRNTICNLIGGLIGTGLVLGMFSLIGIIGTILGVY